MSASFIILSYLYLQNSPAHSQTAHYCNKDNINHIPYCIDNLVNELKKSGFQNENIKNILNSEKQTAKKPSELFLEYSDSEYFEKWFAELLDINNLMWNPNSG